MRREDKEMVGEDLRDKGKGWAQLVFLLQNDCVDPGEVVGPQLWVHPARLPSRQ